MLKPLHDKLLVKHIERVKSTIIDVIMSENSNRGEVVALGAGKRIKGKVRPIDCQIGQIVRYGDTTLNHLNFPVHYVDNVKHYVISEQDICWVEEND